MHGHGSNPQPGRTRAARSIYFYSSERYLVRQAVAAAVVMLSADSDEDATIPDGAAPELEQLIMAAGTISFFGTRRGGAAGIDPAAYGSKRFDELCKEHPFPASGKRRGSAGQRHSHVGTR